jgi:hypothetical protein
VATHALIDRVLQVDAATHLMTTGSAAEPLTAVRLGQSSCYFNSNDARAKPWSALLQNLKESQDPVYIEVDDATNKIERILLPKVFTVVAIKQVAENGDLDVELSISHGKHFLRAANPAFADLKNRLQSALALQAAVLVTETSKDHDIVDVRPVPVIQSQAASAASPLEVGRVPA